MAAPSSMRDKILDAAETRMRGVGFNAVSFRDLAEDVDIKSASIHHHFPRKTDLGVALVARYQDRFGEDLARIDRRKLLPAIKGFVGLYEQALKVGESVCLCAILGSEALSLPVEVTKAVRSFFQMNVDWLSRLFSEHGIKNPPLEPIEIISALEGAMVIANTYGDAAVMRRTAKRILDVFSSL